MKKLNWVSFKENISLITYLLLLIFGGIFKYFFLVQKRTEIQRETNSEIRHTFLRHKPQKIVKNELMELNWSLNSSITITLPSSMPKLNTSI
jgi:hypothetical protein